MNKTTKTLAILFTAGLLLAGCVQKDNTKATTESTSKSTTKAPAESKTKESSKEKSSSSTTVDTKEDSKAGAQKTVLEISDENGKSVMTLYYKGDTLLVQEKVDDYNIAKMDGETTLQGLKASVANSEEKFKDVLGKGFELKSEYKDGIFYISNTIDYTKVDLKKLQEIVPGFQPLEDNTISYSTTKDSFIKSGYVEK